MVNGPERAGHTVSLRGKGIYSDMRQADGLTLAVAEGFTQPKTRNQSVPGVNEPVTKSEYRPGSKADFDRLYQETYPRIFRTLATMLGELAGAEDCAQDAFLKAFRAWPKWKADAPAEAWIHRIALNTAFSFMRKRRLGEVAELIRRLGRPVEIDPTEQVLDSELLREIRRLPAKQAAVLVLRHLHGYTNREIASALGEPESTVASRLMTAKRTLRARLGDSFSNSSDTSATPNVSPVE